MRFTTLLLATTASFAVPAAARPPAPMPAGSSPAVSEVTACRSVTQADARLACFDRATANLDQAVASRSIVVLSAEQVRDTHRSLFGFNLPRIALFAGDKEGESNQLETTAAAVKSLGYGKWRLQLPDGAVWETTDGASDDVYPVIGSKLRIKTGALGNYMMSIDGARGVSSRRIR